ncbi:beta-ketoacyl synthase N-terminal-like domain-containing protein [Kribbella sp. NPDC056861]|uniref:beta-ketoacyl synthase N-terminal-like domain-containing protein n=1 Tax=Kribbella sp. NPDC056861 TaxID=3154857 RepID=UPI003447C4EA
MTAVPVAIVGMGAVADFDPALCPPVPGGLAVDDCVLRVLFGVRQALRDAGIEGPCPRGGLVLGNPSLPTEEGARFADWVRGGGRVFTSESGLLPAARFPFGLPAQLAASALGLGCGGFAVDAEENSSTLALRLAADRLADGRCDLMVIGGIGQVDSDGLRAVLPDGLVPARGGVFFALMRLADARAAGHAVLGLAPPVERVTAADRIVIAGLGVRVGDLVDTAAFTGALIRGEANLRPAVDYALDRQVAEVLADADGSEVAAVAAGLEAIEGLDLPLAATMVILGTGANQAVMPPAGWLARCLGANGESFGVGAEEASGLEAIDLGSRALRSGQADAVVVGAVDLAHDPVHRLAAGLLGLDGPMGDAAVVLVLRRAADVPAEEVIAELEPAGRGPRIGDHGPAVFDPGPVFGVPHAAKGMLAVACTALALRHGATPRLGRPAGAGPRGGRGMVSISVMSAGHRTIGLRARVVRRWGEAPRTWIFSGDDAHRTVASALAGRTSDDGPARLVVRAEDRGQCTERIAAAAEWLAGQRARPRGVAYRERPLEGEVGFVYADHQQLTLTTGGPVADRIWAATRLAQDHTRTSSTGWGLRAAAVLGYSSGELSALVAMGVWDGDSLFADLLEQSGLFEEGCPEVLDWESHLLPIPVAGVRSELRGGTVRILAVNTPASCVIGGPAGDCRAVLAKLGLDPQPFWSRPVHMPQLAAVRNRFQALYSRRITEPAELRLHSGVDGRVYRPTSADVATALTDQTMSMIDFDRTVRRAWDDGVRIYLVHGPGDQCRRWIGEILGSREHLAVSVEDPEAALELLAAGVPVQYDAERTAPAQDLVRLPAHPDDMPSSTWRQVAAVVDQTQPTPQGDEYAALMVALRDAAREPRVPLLLADRVTGVERVHGARWTGTIQTEMTVRPDSWFLDPAWRMPAGLVLESTLAHLLLLAWSLLDDDHGFRLLDAATTFHGAPPEPGQLVSCDAQVDGWTGNDLLFHADCRVDGQLRLTLRAGRAGAPNTVPPAEASWRAVDDPPSERPVIDPPPFFVPATSYSAEQVLAYAAGRPRECFGARWGSQQSHRWMPRIANGPLFRLGRVSGLDFTGGPWRRGYLRVDVPIDPAEWFFDGPGSSMPIGLLYEGGLQALAFYLAALGYTLATGAGRFEPVPDQTVRLRCRGAVTPQTRQLVYEVFVVGVNAGSVPAVIADVTCSADGVQVLHLSRLGVRVERV